MNTQSWWQRLFQNSPKTVRQNSGRSTRLMQVEILEDRRVPANIFITVLGTGDHSGADTPLHNTGGNNFTATDLRNAVDGIGTSNLHGSIFIKLATKTYTVNQGELVLGESLSSSDSLTIENSSGNALSIIDAKHANRIFEVYGGAVVTLDHLQMQNGLAEGVDFPQDPRFASLGGAIFMDVDAVLTLSNDRLTENSAAGVPGEGDSAAGGAIFDSGANLGGPKRGPAGTPSGPINLKIVNTRVDHNSAIASGESFGSAGGAEGGGLCAVGGGTVAITASTFDNNSAIGGSTSGAEGGNGGFAVGGGAAIDSFGNFAKISVVNSTFAKNIAQAGNAINSSYGGGGNAYGGGLTVFLSGGEGSASLVNSTIAFNQALAGVGAPLQNASLQHQPPVGGNVGTSYGGGVALLGNVPLDVLNTIIAKNTGGVNAIVQGPLLHGPLHPPLAPTPNDVANSGASFDDLGHNLIGATDGSTGFGAPTDFLGTAAHPFDPGFAPAGLANNGGPTPTIAILSTSKAVNGGSNSVVTGGTPYSDLGLSSLIDDQRGPGFNRKSGAAVDIGAFEYQFPLNLKGRDLIYDIPGQG